MNKPICKLLTGNGRYAQEKGFAVYFLISQFLLLPKSGP